MTRQHKPPALHLERWLARRGLRAVRIIEQRGRAVLFIDTDPDPDKGDGTRAGDDVQGEHERQASAG